MNNKLIELMGRLQGILYYGLHFDNIYIYICVPLILYSWMLPIDSETVRPRRLKLCMWPLPMGAGKIG